jgi:predicted DsbA family dithiol-disulfide isomerase
MSNETFFIDVWSDVICPFCYLGAQQLDQALADFAHADQVVVRHHAFELDPSAPKDKAMAHNELLSRKYGLTLEQVAASNERLSAQAAAFGLTWHLEQALPTNTFDAHRLIKLAAEQGLEEAMSRRLYAAYFSEGQRVSDPEVLTALANEVGVAGVYQLFEEDHFAEEVREDEETALELGISGVPAFVLDGKFMVNGAQGADQLLSVLDRAWARRSA